MRVLLASLAVLVALACSTYTPPRSPAEAARLAVMAHDRAGKAATLACLAYVVDAAERGTPRDPATDDACASLASPAPEEPPADAGGK